MEKKSVLLKRFITFVLIIVLLTGCINSGGTRDNLPDKLICGLTDNPIHTGGIRDDFITELAMLMGEKLGVEIEFKLIEWENRYVALESGEIDAIWNFFVDYATDPSLVTDIVDVSYAYFVRSLSAVVRTENVDNFKKATDLTGKTGVIEINFQGREFWGKSYIEQSSHLSVQGGLETIHVPNQMDALMEVLSGNADYALVYTPFAERVTGSGDFTSLVIADIDFLYNEFFAIAFEKGSPLRNAANRAMRQLYDDGTLLALAEKYGLEYNIALHEIQFEIP